MTVTLESVNAGFGGTTLSDSERVNKFESLQGETWAAETARIIPRLFR